MRIRRFLSPVIICAVIGGAAFAAPGGASAEGPDKAMAYVTAVRCVNDTCTGIPGGAGATSASVQTAQPAGGAAAAAAKASAPKTQAKSGAAPRGIIGRIQAKRAAKILRRSVPTQQSSTSAPKAQVQNAQPAGGAAPHGLMARIQGRHEAKMAGSWASGRSAVRGYSQGMARLGAYGGGYEFEGGFNNAAINIRIDGVDIYGSNNAVIVQINTQATVVQQNAEDFSENRADIDQDARNRNSGDATAIKIID